MKKYQVTLVKKITRSAVIAIEHENTDKDEVADKAWLKFNMKPPTAQYTYVTRVEEDDNAV